MATITYYVVVPFVRTENGDLMPLEPIEPRDAAAAIARAHTAAATHSGAIAFSRTGDPATGEFSEPTVLIEVGEVDEAMLGG